jgi:hypothetical protein
VARECAPDEGAAMEDNHDKQGGEEPPEKPPRIKASDNPWYLLAVLYRDPADEPDGQLREKL